MPVYPNAGPGYGPGIDAFTQNFINAQLMKRSLAIQQQQAADAHQAAIDAHTGAAIGNAVNYGFIPDGVPVPGVSAPVEQAGSPGYRSPVPQAMTPDNTFQTFMARSMTPAVQSPIASAPQRRGAVTPVAMLGRAPSMLDRTPSADFEQNLTQSFQNAAGGSQSRAGAGAENIPGNPMVSDSRVSIPGVGSIDPMAGFRRQLWLEQQKKGIDTQAQIDVANQTGVTGKNQADTYNAVRHANELLPGDQGYIGYQAALEGAKATAAIPAKLQEMAAQGQISRQTGAYLAQIHGNIQAALQKNAQDFENGKIDKQERFQRDMEQYRLATEFYNRLGEINYQALGTVEGHIIDRPPMPTQAPSDVVTQRTDWDTAAAALRLQKKDPASVLGPRP